MCSAAWEWVVATSSSEKEVHISHCLRKGLLFAVLQFYSFPQPGFWDSKRLREELHYEFVPSSTSSCRYTRWARQSLSLMESSPQLTSLSTLPVPCVCALRFVVAFLPLWALESPEAPVQRHLRLLLLTECLLICVLYPSEWARARWGFCSDA